MLNPVIQNMAMLMVLCALTIACGPTPQEQELQKLKDLNTSAYERNVEMKAVNYAEHQEFYTSGDIIIHLADELLMAMENAEDCEGFVKDAVLFRPYIDDAEYRNTYSLIEIKKSIQRFEAMLKEYNYPLNTPKDSLLITYDRTMHAGGRMTWEDYNFKPLDCMKMKLTLNRLKQNVFRVVEDVQE